MKKIDDYQEVEELENDIELENMIKILLKNADKLDK